MSACSPAVRGGALHVAWFPTFTCQLRCCYCNARAVALSRIGRELSAPEWVRVFQACPRPLSRLMISGGEPSLHPATRDVMAAVACDIHFNSNMVVHPERWVPPEAFGRIRSCTCSLQFSPDSPQAAVYWGHVAWLKRALPATAHISPHYISHQGTAEWQRQMVVEAATAMGLPWGVLPVDDHWAYRDALPRREMTARCDGGQVAVVLFPDGTAFRCIGQAWAWMEPLGNVARDGWGILLDAPAACEECFCIRVEECEPVRIEKLTGSGNHERLMPGWRKDWHDVGQE